MLARASTELSSAEVGSQLTLLHISLLPASFIFLEKQYATSTMGRNVNVNPNSRRRRRRRRRRKRRRRRGRSNERCSFKYVVPNNSIVSQKMRIYSMVIDIHVQKMNRIQSKMMKGYDHRL
jgi:hypothetical protein